MPTEVMPAAHRSRAPRLPAGERRLQILDVAVEIFARDGYAATGTADIAIAAGIGEPTIYRYFDSKQDLYLAALRRAGEEVMENWRRIASENPDPVSALLLIGAWYREALQKRPQILKLRARSMVEGPNIGVELGRKTYLELREFIEGLFARARDQGRIAEDADIRTLTWLFMAIGALMDLSQQVDLQDEFSPGDLVKVSRAVLYGTARIGTPEGEHPWY
jgi:AcrR family transcriptional regulator